MAKKSARLSSKLPLTAAGVLPKADLLERWQQLPAGKTLAMEAVAAGKGGSSYEEDSIRLTGSLKYIDSVLSNLRGLLRFENTKTRLDVAFSQQKDKVTRQPRPGKYVCYIKVVEKVRTTRARVATPASARAKAITPKPPVAGVSPLAAFVGEFTQAGRAVVKDYHAKQITDALAGLITLGYKRLDAEQRLAAVIEEHGKMLNTADYIKLVLTHSK